MAEQQQPQPLTPEQQEKASKLFILGELKCTDKAVPLYAQNPGQQIEFMTRLQALMEEFGIVKIDIGMDPFKVIEVLKTRK